LFAVVVAVTLALAVVWRLKVQRGSAAPAGKAANVVDVVEANASVVKVVDGDTVELRIGRKKERVRLIGINTPETVDPRRPVECFGPEAKAETKHLLPPGTRVRLERDLEARDDYGRLLGYVTRAADGLFVNLHLVQQGFAVPLAIAPNTARAAVFAEAAHGASTGARGLWSACPG
jgi:micrococcal nuclease